MGPGLGVSIFDFRAEGGEPGTLKNKEDTEAGIFPSGTTFFTWRISRRWAFNIRHNQLKLIDDTADGKYQDSHADVQFRWRPNLAFGLGYSRMRIDLDVHDNDEPFLFDLECKGRKLLPRELLARSRRAGIPPRARWCRRRVARRYVPGPGCATTSRAESRTQAPLPARRRDIVVFVMHHQHRDAHTRRSGRH